MYVSVHFISALLPVPLTIETTLNHAIISQSNNE